jgi:hypothetical protein
MAKKKKVELDTWPKRDSVSDEDARQSKTGARERTGEARQRPDDAERLEKEQSPKKDPGPQ